MVDPLTIEDSVFIGNDFRHVPFDIENYIKFELSTKLDSDEQICHPFLTPAGCPLGAKCPLRHVPTPSPLNFNPAVASAATANAAARTVCKHWLRGLCKKGATCEFLHEYNLRKMPECWFFAKFGYCSNGDECMYLHVDDMMRRTECPEYRRGFCPEGPDCPLKHVRRPLCLAYVIGFCPNGPECIYGHPKRDLEPAPPFRAGMVSAPPPANYDGHKGHKGEESGEGQNHRRRGKNVDDVVCFKCGQRGHFANNCPNPAVPGRRGGVERGPGGRALEPREDVLRALP